MRLLTESTDRQMKLLVQFFHVQQDQVSHFHVLQLLPQFLDGVEVGGVRRQGLKPDFSPQTRYEFSYHYPAVKWATRPKSPAAASPLRAANG